MSRVRRHFDAAVTAFQQARTSLSAAQESLRRGASERGAAAAGTEAAVGGLVAEVAATGRLLTQPGWRGLDVRRLGMDLPPLGEQPPGDGPMLLHAGIGWLSPDSWFPLVLPLLGEGGGHWLVDAGLRTRAASSLLRAVLVRLLGAMPQGLLDVRLVDGATAGSVFTPFHPLISAGGMAPVAIDAQSVAAVMDEAEEHVRRTQALAAQGRLDGAPWMVVCGQLPESRADLARVQALAHAGPGGRLHFVLAGWPPPGPGERPVLDHGFTFAVDGQYARLADPPGKAMFSADGSGMPVPVSLDDDPNLQAVAELCRRLAANARSAAALTFADLVPGELQSASSARGLSTAVGFEGRDEVALAFDDVTPHWLVAGRSGSGKTVFLLDVLYGLAARYHPRELALYLLDFKEGVSFAEFSPSDRDPTYIPHARAIGIESDREYGIAVLRSLNTEMTARSGAMKRHGVTTLAALRAADSQGHWPRIVAVIDEFHVLLSGPGKQAAVAVGLLEDLARKGRSYGIHLLLASQTISGVDALVTKKESIFAQFPLRIALAGAAGILDPANTGVEGLQVGQMIVNDAAGAPGRNRVVRFPDAHAAPDAIAALRTRLWTMRPEGLAPPHVFQGFAEQHVDPVLALLASEQPAVVRLAVGRAVDLASSVATVTLDASPGRHLAVLGASAVGADVLHAATLTLAAQHLAGTVRFLIAPLAAAAQDTAADLTMRLAASGHACAQVTADGLPGVLAGLADGGKDTYLVLLGADAASATLTARDPATRRSGADDLRAVLASGPGRGVHVLGWWRSTRRLADDLGGSAGRDLISCLLALNVTGPDLATLTGDPMLEWQPRPNRALLLDAHNHTRQLIVPFVWPGRHDDLTAGESL
ncbi:FtsK/SpoIIIE domain-containing protein [Longispora albida]|uniref:FtsK/SpoIIIE domain-containing protein n=1 Tax=Longispora albida TaxID=203523 RepID=UPI0004757107|nr:FtsK/SpoIIIE domain-containing protein [Longispora albida]